MKACVAWSNFAFLAIYVSFVCYKYKIYTCIILQRSKKKWLCRNLIRMVTTYKWLYRFYDKRFRVYSSPCYPSPSSLAIPRVITNRAIINILFTTAVTKFSVSILTFHVVVGLIESRCFLRAEFQCLSTCPTSRHV